MARLPSIWAQRASDAHELEDLIASDLEHGTMVAGRAGFVEDLMAPDPAVLLREDQVADGQWVWPGSLPYYVTTYHVRISAVLVDRMRTANWQPPEVAESEQAKVQRLLANYLGLVQCDQWPEEQDLSPGCEGAGT